MPVKIRLMRIGTSKRPFYRVVAVDERKKRTGSFLELLGTYNPLTEPKEIILKKERIEHWQKQGAILSDGFLRIIGKAPKRPPRPPKKAKLNPAQAAPSNQNIEVSAAKLAEESEPKEQSISSSDSSQTEETKPVESESAESASPDNDMTNQENHDKTDKELEKSK